MSVFHLNYLIRGLWLVKKNIFCICLEIVAMKRNSSEIGIVMTKIMKIMLQMLTMITVTSALISMILPVPIFVVGSSLQHYLISGTTFRVQSLCIEGELALPVWSAYDGLLVRKLCWLSDISYRSWFAASSALDSFGFVKCALHAQRKACLN